MKPVLPVRMIFIMKGCCQCCLRMRDECPVGNEMRWSIVVCFRVITEAAEIIRINVISVFYICSYMSAQVMMKWDIEIWSGFRHVHRFHRAGRTKELQPTGTSFLPQGKLSTMTSMHISALNIAYPVLLHVSFFIFSDDLNGRS